MEDCELCGKSTKSVYVVNVEDVELRVCASCAQGKKVIEKPSYAQAVVRTSTRPKRDEDQQLIENYGDAMRRAREQMKLPLKVLAEMLNEKETLLARIEQQGTLPTVELTKKIEKALGIKLVANAENQDSGSKSGVRKEGATLGEFVNRK